MRDMVMIVDESLVNECQAAETRQMVWFVDATIESRPMVVSNFNVREGAENSAAAAGASARIPRTRAWRPCSIRSLPSRLGSMPACAPSTSAIPISPKEVGYFIPAITEATEKRCIKVDGQDRCKTAIQSNNVETDDRGYIYVVDRANTGMHILELTGEARAIAGLQ